ncbi:hypothetical protein [Rubinisphaera sp.]|uniref:hypothetical protein n=1 Tax=Rubinisphaera sp. TaxID=2024857 RepID=UPI000C0E61D4|nr:hypothetical protein [Rubinisphaera sp.]MBV08211.1 hypothetical protein [Rubinisphaera sp.]HCS54681.1 hypothetical protein [Planctomycetaceae bacterium]|tara:strand:+ start:715 stop:1266 length:552 start_codon:yes stop_codon:yes gene_type:complete
MILPQQVSIMVLFKTRKSCEDALRSLYRYLDERRQPEDVKKDLMSILDCTADERRFLDKAAKSRHEEHWSSMSSDFSRQVNLGRQLKVAEQLFGHSVSFSPDDLVQIEQWIINAEQSIGKVFLLALDILMVHLFCLRAIKKAAAFPVRKNCGFVHSGIVHSSFVRGSVSCSDIFALLSSNVNS